VAKERKRVVITFKVSLEGARQIWRRIDARDDQTLDDLHEAIYEAFDREEEHLYSFYFPAPGARGRARLRRAIKIDCPEAAAGPILSQDEPLPNTAEIRLSQLGLTPRQRFLYLFDFGDKWLHDITVGKVDGIPDGGDYPRIVEKHDGSPAQYADND